MSNDLIYQTVKKNCFEIFVFYYEEEDEKREVDCSSITSYKFIILCRACKNTAGDDGASGTTVVVNIGDIAYSDGTVSANYDSTKKSEGIVLEVVDGYATKIVNLDQTKLAWSTEEYDEYETDATSKTDGKENLESIKAIDGWQDKYPVFKWCDEYTDASNNSEWYLPAQDELNQIYLAKETINEAIEKITSAEGTATLVTDDLYWSSTELHSTAVCNQKFTNGDYGMSHKDSVLATRAIRSF